MADSNSIAPTRSSPLLIAAAWAIVVLPTAWGLSYTVQNALKIFTKPPVAVAVPANSSR